MALSAPHAARVLDLDLTATLEDVKRVRRRLAFRYHPDRTDDPVTATRHMARINAAADTLMAFIKGKKTGGLASDATKPDPSEKHARTARKTQKPGQRPQPKTQFSKAEQALVRSAASSYSTTLLNIGRHSITASVDLRILKQKERSVF